MRFTVFHHFSLAHNKRTALVMATLLLAGCSSNTMRFADGMFTNSTSTKQAESRPVPAQPIPPAVTVANERIESSELPPMTGEAMANESVRQEPAVQVAGLGAPPRNLGTLPAHEVKPPVVDNSNKDAATSRYIVQSGDTLSRIASRRGVSVARIREANGLSTDTIRIGQALTIPGGTAPQPQRLADARTTSPAEAPKVASITAVVTPTVANSAPPPVEQVKVEVPKSAPVTPKDEIKPEPQQVAVVTPPNVAAGLRWPAKGRILSGFGQREGTLTNDGVDIMVPEGTPVKAAESGVVIYAGDGLKEFGNTILIRHEDNLVTVYGHNGQLLVQRGQKVRRGDEIAKSGKSGNTTTPKLHFEVRKNSTPVNPMKYLES